LPFTSIIKNKPILVIDGQQGSGKSLALEGITCIFTGATQLTSLNSEKDFDALIVNNIFGFIDNFDTMLNKDWILDKLAIFSTGSVLKTRQLYTNNEEITQKISCWFGLTSRTGVYKRPDLLQRTLLFRVSQIKENFLNKNEVFTLIEKNRNNIMTLILQQLNQIIKNLKTNPVVMRNDFRMADWAGLVLQMTANNVEKNIYEILNKVVKQENDELIDLINTYIAEYEILEGSTQEIFYKLKDFSLKNEQDTSFIKNVKSFGLMLKYRITILENEFDFKSVNIHGARKYAIKSKSGYN